MINLSVPGREMNMELKNLVLDLNGTLSVDGILAAGVESRVALLKKELKVYLLTSDTLGCGSTVAEDLGISIFKVGNEHGGEDKLDFLNTVGAEETVVIGNGFNDRLVLEHAALSIAVIGGEGCCVQALQKADIVVKDIQDALDLLLRPLRIVATLRD
ncbi:MAG: ATPase P [Firmicutes bacterium HGW-Firmicutes-15]|nr:MAG: ATPase P [Firmicutes bacterium HGW-Firmicutes-15]